ncbi:Cytoplasmic 60S subunit biogenesis factor REH1 [Candida viswanathii]|uniref:Cytoplasmic 60S subunit biogenesis factor REH1 n=1 Tax=Candida viswanathii TaxID=5486 RepID=A0A367YMR9_9ASCO|nr:Cytoplasmic 60S subunit biogenesis factor REH1 [Candida viswanathii]
MSFMPKGSNPETASFTCNTCGVKFINAELQRQHMKTEWHRYNLKRRVASLPSISSELFAEKIISLKNMAKNENEDEYGFYVATRKKKKNSNGDRQVTKKFLKSQQSRGRAAEIVSAASAVRSVSPASSIASEFSQFSINDSDYHEVESVETGSEINYTEESEFSDLGDELYSDEDGEDHDHDEEESEDETECIPITHCFYCGANNHEIENNIKHMFNRHGLYIPERSFLVDVEGLLEYLSEVISLDHECLVCGFEGKNLESIRQHITSKGHCKIPYETKEEKLAVAEFYDFIGEDYDEQVANNKEEKNPEKHVGFGEDVPEEATEEGSDGNGINDNYALVAIDSSGVELTTPTGSRIGHRSMQRYYRQNIQLPREYSAAQTTQALVDRRYAPGLTVYQATKQEKEVRKLENKARNVRERRTNKPKKVNFQKHFRDEILGT